MGIDKENRGIILLLSIIVLLIGFFSYQNYIAYSQLQNAFEQEKLGLEGELQNIIVEYDNLITKSAKFQSNYTNSRNEILKLRDTIKNLKEENYRFFKKYRKRIANLAKQNRVLSQKIDSLSVVNNNLVKENLEVKKELIVEESSKAKINKKYSSLKQEHQKLKQKVNVAQKLEIENLNILLMKRKLSGKYVTTKRRKKIKAFKISLNILSNKSANPGKRKVYIQIIDQTNKVLSKKGSFTISSNKKKLNYSDVITVNYENRKASVISIVNFEKLPVEKGKYLVNVFMENELVGNRIVSI